MQLDKDPEETGAPSSSEADADWAALERIADADPNALPDPNAPEPAPLAAPLNEEIAGLVLMLSKVAGPAFPSLATIYTEETCGAVGAAVAGVCDKYGWLQGGVGGEYGPEIMFLCVVGPLAFTTHNAVQADIEARRAKERAKNPNGLATKEPPPGAYRAPGSDTVTIGAPVA